MPTLRFELARTRIIDTTTGAARRTLSTMLLAEVVRTSEAVASTRARLAKVASLADLLRLLEAVEIEPGRRDAHRREPPGPDRRRLGHLRRRPAAGSRAGPSRSWNSTPRSPSRAPGQGSGARRRVLGDLFARATAAEADFLRRLLAGELRQGALAGVMTDAVAGVGRPAAAVRRAAMLAGDLARVAAVALTGRAGPRRGRPRGAPPVLPMLAATVARRGRRPSTDVGPASVEWKLDGARIQVHRAATTSASSPATSTTSPPACPASSTWSGRLAVDQVVLDGEAIGVDATSGRTRSRTR